MATAMTQDEVKEATQALLAWGHAALEPKAGPQSSVAFSEDFGAELEELKARALAQPLDSCSNA